MRPQVAFIMNSMMKDVVNRGTAAKVRARGFKANVAGKTGTSRDGWFAGFTPKLVCVVYVGFDDNSDLGMTGGDSALPIWTDFMSAALAAHPDWGGDWQMPADIEQVEIDPTTGMLPAPGSTSRRPEFFIQGTAPTEQSEPSDETGEEGEEELEPGGELPLPTPGGDIVVPPLPDATPPPGNRPRNLPGGDGRASPLHDQPSRLSGTVTLDIDPTTNLIADPSVCPVIRSRSFTIGTEPRRPCGPQYHRHQTIIPAEPTRPPRVSP